MRFMLGFVIGSMVTLESIKRLYYGGVIKWYTYQI